MGNSRAYPFSAVIRVALSLAAVLGVEPALAQRNIGAAVTIEREVSGTLAGRNRALNSGDGVFSNENIRTANASAAQLQFLDQTKLAIGPSASVVLDRFIYNPDRTAREVTVEVARGAARWFGGVSRSQAYHVRTPHASIGVRGTIFDLLVEARRTIVTLREGVIVVCTIGAPQRCVTLDTPGQVVIVTRTTIEGPSRASSSETRFAELCLRPVDRSACVFTTTAELTPTPAWGDGFYAGVHGGGVVSRPGPVNVDGTAAVLASIAAGNVPGTIETQGLGALGGVQAGYSWRFGPGVVGLEADFSALNARASGDVPLDPCGCLTVTTTATQMLDYLGTLRARAGITAGDLFAYGTAGLAVGHIRLDGSIVPAAAGNPTYVGNRSLLRAGYVVGGGVEFALASPLSLRAEYLHYELGKQTLGLDEITGLAPGESAVMQFRTRGDLVRVGINVSFAGWPTAASAMEIPSHSALAYAGSVYKAPPPPPPAPLFSWTGFYAGAHGGAGWAHKDWFFGGLAGIAVPPGPEGSHVATGGLAGGQLGFNYQIGPWVWGVEEDASWANLRGDNISAIFSPLVLSTGNQMVGNRNTTVVNGLGTLAGRVGFASDRTLLYVKAGGAWASDKYRVLDLATGGVVATSSETRWGWVAGIGIERAFLENWSVKIEYNYMDFGKKHVALNCVPGSCTGTVAEEISQNVSIIKAGINYRFGRPITASY